MPPATLPQHLIPPTTKKDKTIDIESLAWQDLHLRVVLLRLLSPLLDELSARTVT